MQTRIFEWWKGQGRTLRELAERLHYNYRYLCALHQGHYPITESFMARCVMHLGDHVRSLFFLAENVGSEQRYVGSSDQGQIRGKQGDGGRGSSDDPDLCQRQGLR